jgi:hypothetical protein
VCPDSTGSRGEDLEETAALGGATFPRPYGPRPYGPRPYGPRPYGPRAGAPPPQPDPYGPRPYGPRPYGPRPYGPRPYGPRPYGPRDEAPSGALDPDEWSADVADLFCAESAVVRLGARVVFDEDDLPVAALEPPLGHADYVEQARGTSPKDKKPFVKDSAPTPSAGVSQRHLHARRHELAVKVVIPNALGRTLVEYPEVAWALKQDLAHALALRADQAFLHGAGGTPSSGVVHTAATVEHTPGTDRRQLLMVVRDMVGAMRIGEARFGNAGWVLHPRTLEGLSRLLTSNGQAETDPGWGLEAVLLLAHDGHDGGVLLGYPFVVSSATEDGNTTRIHFASDWSEAWIGADRQLVTVDVSVDALFATDETVIRAVMHHDFVVRRPEYFVYADAPA